jgi:hypothetical protein
VGDRKYMTKEKSITESSVHNGDGTEGNSGSEAKYDRTRDTVVLLTVILSCSFILGAAKGILTPYFSDLGPFEMGLLSAIMAIIVYAPALFWYQKIYQKKK